MGTARIDPRLCAHSQIRLRCPECCCDRKLRHFLLRMLYIDFVDDQTEAVSQIYERARNSVSFFRGEYQSRRILAVTHGERFLPDGDLAVRDTRADLQHVRLQNAFLPLHKVVGIIFKECSSLSVLLPFCHELHDSDKSSRLPVALRAETVTLFHKALNCKTRELLKSAKVAKVRYHCLVIILFAEFFDSELDLRLHFDVLSEFLRVPALLDNLVCAVIFFRQSFRLAVGDGIHILNKDIDRPCVDFPSEFDLRFDLIAFRHGNISHVICKSGYSHMRALEHADCHVHPGSQLFHHCLVFPVTGNDLSLDAHSGDDMAVLSSAVSRLVLIHEVHVDRLIGDFLIVLCMEMAKRLAVLLKSEDPALGR